MKAKNSSTKCTLYLVLLLHPNRCSTPRWISACCAWYYSVRRGGRVWFAIYSDTLAKDLTQLGGGVCKKKHNTLKHKNTNLHRDSWACSMRHPRKVAQKSFRNLILSKSDPPLPFSSPLQTKHIHQVPLQYVSPAQLTKSLLHLGLHHHSLRRPIGVRLQLQYLRLQHNLLQELVQTGLLLRRHHGNLVNEGRIKTDGGGGAQGGVVTKPLSFRETATMALTQSLIFYS